MQKAFKCCRNISATYVVLCLCVFHPSCTERLNDVVKLGGYRIFCSTKCQSVAQEREDENKHMLEKIEGMEKELREKDKYITHLKRTSATLDDSVYDAERKFISEIEKQNKHIQTLKEQLNTMKKDEVEKRKKLESLEEEKDKSDQSVKEMTEMIKNKIVIIEALEGNNSILEKELKDMRQKAEQKEEQQKQEEKKRRKSEKENLDLKQQVKHNTDKTAKNEDELRTEKEVNKKMRATIEALEKRNNILERELKKTRQNEEQKENQQKENQQKQKKKIMESEKENLELRQQIKRSTEEVAKKEDVARLNALVSNMQQQLNDMRETTKQSLELLENKILQKARVTPSLESVIANEKIIKPQQPRHYADKVKKRPEEADKNQQETVTWETQKRRRYRNIANVHENLHDDNRARTQTSGRPEPRRGTSENKFLKTTQKKSSIFVSGLAPDVTKEEILEFLKRNQLRTDCVCEKMYTRKDKYKASFKLTVPYENRENYLSSSLWPKGVIANHFLHLNIINQRPK